MPLGRAISFFQISPLDGASRTGGGYLALWFSPGLRKGSEANARSEKLQRKEPNLPTDPQEKQSYGEIVSAPFPGGFK